MVNVMDAIEQPDQAMRGSTTYNATAVAATTPNEVAIADDNEEITYDSCSFSCSCASRHVGQVGRGINHCATAIEQQKDGNED